MDEVRRQPRSKTEFSWNPALNEIRRNRTAALTDRVLEFRVLTVRDLLRPRDLLFKPVRCR